MEIKLDLKESKFDGVKFFGKLILGEDDETFSVNITVRENDGELFVCYPSKKNKDGEFFNEVFASEKLYKKINKVLNKNYK